MKKYYIIPLMVVIIASLAAAPAVQADLISLTLILSGVFFSGVAVNEVVIENNNQSTDSLNTEMNRGP